MGVNGSQKGSAFEREIAKSLSLWASDGDDAHIFSRRQGSGGSQRDKHGHSGSGGDIYADKHEGSWLTNHAIFELKFYKDLKPDLWWFIASDKGMFKDFIAQVLEDATTYKRGWMVVIKTNRLPILCLTNSLILSRFVEGSITFNPLGERERMHMFPFENFLKVKPVKIQEALSSLSEDDGKDVA